MADEFAGEITVNGVRLYARAQGRADGPPVVLVNSLATDHGIWDAQMPALLPKYRVLRYDVRGHGRSAAPAGPYSMAALADDLLGVIAHFGHTRAHVVGVSLGGLTAMEAALRRPAAIAGIVPCDCRADMPAEFAQGIAARNALVREKGMAAIADTMIERWFTAGTRALAPPYLERIRAMIRDTSVEGFAGCAEAIRGSTLRPRVREIAVPALFMVGDADAALPVALMQAMQSEVAGARLEIIAAAGHLPNVERPAEFNAALLRFLDGGAA